MNNIAFQLPATRVKPESPTVGKKESTTDKATSPFNRLLNRTMSSQQSTNISGEEQADVNAPNDPDSPMSQGIANNLLLALVAVPPVMPANTQPPLNHSDVPTTNVQFAGPLMNIANQNAGIPLSPHLQQQTSSDAQCDSMVASESMPPLVTPASGKTVFVADGLAPLSPQDTVSAKQLETNIIALPQRELQSKLESVVSTTANPFSPVDPSSEPPQSSPTVIPQLPAQDELPKGLPGEELMSDPVLTPKQTQSAISATSELPLANQPVMPLGRREQIVVKQPTGTELSNVAPVQAQSLLNQQSQDDNDFLSRDSFPTNHGLTELRAGKLDEPVFETTPQMTTPNQHDIIRQIVDRARLYLRPANQSEMVLQLRPEHLGELTLKVSVASGVVSATFHSDNPEVRQVIEASLPQLKQDLSQQGIKLDSVSVFSGSEQFFDNRQYSAQQQSVPLRKNRRELLQAIDSAEEVSVGTTDGVDYRI